MQSIHEIMKKMTATPLFYFIAIGLGLVFTVFFAFFNRQTAAIISLIVFLSVIFFSLLAAFIMRCNKAGIELAIWLNEKDRSGCALKILMHARKRVSDREELFKLNYEISVVYCTMEQYHQAVDILCKILKECDKEWSWKVYFQWLYLIQKAIFHPKL